MHIQSLLSTLLIALLTGPALSGQEALENYLQQALESNIALQQKELSYEKSLAALKEAKAMFLPTVAIEARYSRARGGRAIEFPVGDLLNPVYDNLNLVNELGQVASPDYPAIPAYPMIANESINFLREEEHETKVRMIWPVFNAAILHNHRIKQDQLAIDRISVEVYKRELVKEVKVAYYNYGKATEAVTLYQNTLALVQENLRTTQSLYRNHQVTLDEVYAAETQVKEVERQLTEAERNRELGRAYFNFLLNRDFEATVELDPPAGPEFAGTLESARAGAVQSREELRQLDQYLELADEKVKLDRGNFLPSLNLVGDYGFQGTSYSFTSNDDFAMGSLVLSWKLFDRPSKMAVEQSIVQRTIVEQQRQEAQQQIGLQTTQAFYDLQAARKQLELADARLQSAGQAYKLVEKKYRQGQANLVTFTDARTRLTNAEQQKIIDKYDYFIRQAELERSMASYPVR
ncbi:MAG: TolC family protein [Saprospiraceae bacterium]|nr:TolC family protein [Saprospiraceae bacterium]